MPRFAADCYIAQRGAASSKMSILITRVPHASLLHCRHLDDSAMFSMSRAH